MEMRVADWSDIESVLSRLSDQHRVEYEHMGYPGSGFMTKLVRFLAKGETQALWFDGQPQAFISIAPDNGLVTTWLGLTGECFAKGIGPIRIGRKYMQDAVQRHGAIVSLLTSPHPKIVQWMRLLGAELKADDGQMKLFIFGENA